MKYILKAYHKYRLCKNKLGVDIVPVEDREVPKWIYDQYEEVTDDKIKNS